VLRLELKSAVVAPVSARTHEGLNEEIDRLRRQVEALKNEITKLKDAREQTAQMITALKAAEQETRAPVPSTYWYSDPTAGGFGIESQSKREGAVPLPRRRGFVDSLLDPARVHGPFAGVQRRAPSANPREIRDLLQ
jgi:cell division septum initiation protein DivIVA